MRHYQVDTHDRIHIIEPDRPANHNRIRRNVWAAYILLATAGFSFIILFLGRVA